MVIAIRPLKSAQPDRESAGRDAIFEMRPNHHFTRPASSEQQHRVKSISSQGVQERDQVGPFLVSEFDGEAVFIEVHHLAQVGGEAVVEVWRSRGQAAQDRALELADVDPPAREQSAAGVGRLAGLACLVVALDGTCRDVPWVAWQPVVSAQCSLGLLFWNIAVPVSPVHHGGMGTLGNTMTREPGAVEPSRGVWTSDWITSVLAVSAIFAVGFGVALIVGQEDNEAVESPLMMSVAHQLMAGPWELYGPFGAQNPLVLIHAPLYYHAAALAAWPLTRLGLDPISAARLAGRSLAFAGLALTALAAYHLARLGGVGGAGQMVGRLPDRHRSGHRGHALLRTP